LSRTVLLVGTLDRSGPTQTNPRVVPPRRPERSGGDDRI
jgi:hypothetical protein